MASRGTRNRRRFLCMDCGNDTGQMKEFYFVATELWLAATKLIKGMLCIGCLEFRIRRRLVASDFTDASINSPYHGEKSARLLDRLTH